MLARWPIQNKLWLCVALLFCIVATLAFSSFRGVYAYRQLARTISARATELPLAGELSRGLGNLRVTLSRARSVHSLPLGPQPDSVDCAVLRQEFRAQIMAVEDALAQYQLALEREIPEINRFGDRSHERATLDAIHDALKHLAKSKDDPDWVLDQLRVESLAAEVDEMHNLAGTLPQHLHTRMHEVAGEVRGQYRTWIVLAWVTTILAGMILLVLLRLFYSWVAAPLRVLIDGSRRIARGDFQYRLHLATHDEMAELADALNAMTRRFQEIRDDLDRQVQLRTKEVVRSERLASVGFLAAGVAHEINNPLASIAWCAESLESRLHDRLPGASDVADASDSAGEDEEGKVIRKYLRTIQDEAFRCKGITDSLLDFSRLGDMQKHPTNLVELVEGVIDMVRHLGKYRHKHVEFRVREQVEAPVVAQEIKQVMLNLVTNGLDSLDPGGTVWIDLRRTGDRAELVVADNGCGMTAEVLEHLYEPFFTRRRDGQGTGLGLSITYRIVEDHGGRLQAASGGPGMGSTFTVQLPLSLSDQEKARKHERPPERRLQAA